MQESPGLGRMSPLMAIAGQNDSETPYTLLQGAGDTAVELPGRTSQSTARWGMRCRLGEAVEVQVRLRNKTHAQLEASLSLACHSADAAPDWDLGGNSSSVLWAGPLTGGCPLGVSAGRVESVALSWLSCCFRRQRVLCIALSNRLRPFVAPAASQPDNHVF